MPELTCTTVHYFRHSHRSWEKILDRIFAAGFKGIDLYVPWGVHEKGKGACDFGEKDRNLDLGRFLRLVRERGRWVILRPGPHVNAELPNFGLPDRIVADPAVQARSPGGNPVLCPFMPDPFPIPSYASEAYLDETRTWFGKVREAVGDLSGQEGFIRMVQIDNEASLFFRDGPFDQDYHPQAAAMFRSWLVRQGLEPADPPVCLEPGFDGARLGLLWIRFRQWMIIQSLARMKGFLEEAGLRGLTFTHNLPPGGMMSVLSPAELKAAVGSVTTDIYCTAEDIRPAMHQVLLMASVEEKPLAGEMGTGTVYYTPYVTEFDNRFALVASLACGLRGANLYMGAARDRWLGGLLSEDGKADKSSLIHFYQRLFMLMDSLEMEKFSPAAAACVVLPRAYMDHSILMFPFTGLSPLLVSGFGLRYDTFLLEGEMSLGEEIQLRWLERNEAVFSLLAERSLFYILGEGVEALGAMKARFEDLELLFVPTFLFMDPRILETMIEWSSRGAAVIAGPQVPQLDHLLRPLEAGLVARLERLSEEGGILLSRDPAGDRQLGLKVEQAASKFWGSLPFRVTKKHPSTQLVVHRHRDGGRWLLFVIHQLGEKSATVVEFDRGRVCEKLLHIAGQGDTGEFARIEWKKEKMISLEHGGHEIVLLQVR